MNWFKRILARAEEERPVDEKFRVGQLWRYRTRPQDEGSLVLIGRVEKLPRRSSVPGAPTSEEIVLGVQVQGLEIKAAAPNEEILTQITHLPLDRLAMEASVTELVNEREPVPADFFEGYEMWRKAFDRGAAGVYKYPLAQCVELAERTFNQK